MSKVHQVFIYRHVKEVETIQAKIQESEEKAKTGLDIQVGLCLWQKADH
jgi:hypothetical protein